MPFHHHDDIIETLETQIADRTGENSHLRAAIEQAVLDLSATVEPLSLARTAGKVLSDLRAALED